MACLVMMFGTSCAFGDKSQDVSSALDEVADKPAARSEELDKTGFFYTWRGEAVTPIKADENGMILIGSDTKKSQALWENFQNAVKERRKTSLMVTDGSSLTVIDTSVSGEDYIALIQKKVYEDGRAVNTGQYVSPAKLSCVRDKDEQRLEYYFSDCLVYSCPADNAQEGAFADIPAEFTAYPAKDDAGVTFPFQKTFSSMGDFDAYYEKYHLILGLDDMKAYIEKQESEGGFNTNIFFLYADMADNDEAQYSFLRAVKENDGLVIYLKRSMPGQKASGLSKWQLMCRVPSEYLHEIEPNNITWVIYNDVITKG